MVDGRTLLGKQRRHSAAEYAISGQHLPTAEALALARGQCDQLVGGAFLDVVHGRIYRISHFCYSANWAAQLA